MEANTTIEATAFAVLLNNCLFLLVATGSAFLFPPTVTSYVVSVSLGAAFATLATASQLH